MKNIELKNTPMRKERRKHWVLTHFEEFDQEMNTREV